MGEAKASYSHKTWAEVCFSAPHLPHAGYFSAHQVKISSHGVMSNKEATLDCVPLKDNIMVCTVGLRPEISFRGCPW